MKMVTRLHTLRVNLFLECTRLEVCDCFPTIRAYLSLVVCPVFKKKVFRKRENSTWILKTNEVLLREV